jgi:hypothetical protein
VSELIPYGGLGCQGSAPMPFVKQRRRGWLDGLPSRSMGRRGRRSGDRPMQRAAGAPGACLRVTSGPLPPRGDGSTGPDPASRPPAGVTA